MNSNFFQLYGIISLIAIIGFVIFSIFWVIMWINKKLMFRSISATLVSLACAAVSIASIIFNIGWIRFMMIFSLFPIVHALIFWYTNMLAAKHKSDIPKVALTNVLFIITYLIFWVFLPDGSDYGPSYFMFGQIADDKFCNIAWLVSCVAGLAHVVLFFVQLIQIGVINSKKRS